MVSTSMNIYHLDDPFHEAAIHVQELPPLCSASRAKKDEACHVVDFVLLETVVATFFATAPVHLANVPESPSPV